MATGRAYKRGKKFYITINKGIVEGKRIRETRATNAKSKRDAEGILAEELYRLNRASALGGPMDNNYL